MLRRLLAMFFTVLMVPHMALACDGRVVEDARLYGSPLCMPVMPQRVVVLDQSFSLGIGLELGLPIVGAPLANMSDDTLRAQAQDAGIVDLGFITDPSLERIVALQPDLIVAFTGNAGLAQSIYPMLSSLAPTLLDVSGDWRGFYDIIADLTGKHDKVQTLFADYNARLAAIKTRVPDTPVSIVRITSWDFQVYTDAPNAYAPFEVLAQAGVRRSPYETAPQGPALKRPDWEELAGLDGDLLLYIVGGTNDSATNGRHEEVINNPLWRMLPAVQAGHVQRLDPATWMEFSGLASAHRVLDDIETYVINAP
ncbi:ABC transporter substrate-binding protein [Roseobacter sp.]|uniref:ABC transporter substrate-binding protein n=1 Tax=Roseobacter sp. TaxID=1907202 RepID=UPI00329874B2